MLFSSLEFLFAFLPLVLLLYYLLKDRYRNYLLLLCSLFFYAWGEPRFVFIMVAIIMLDYVLALLIARQQQQGGTGRLWMVLTVVSNLSLLFVYKYMNFFTSNLARLAGSRVYLTRIVLPIGISFFLFQSMSYVIDVYRKKAQAQKNPFHLGLYISFFPQMMAGPIIRYTTIADQIAKRAVTLDDFAEGVKRFIIGLGKKVVLANAFATVADKAFALAGTTELSISFAWLGIISYSFQIYFDFSGYSDMAIGLGRMFGFHFPENFRYPYVSASISEFWRRWHISLGSWFRDYVYFPLGGSRVKSRWRLVGNLFVVWSLTGLWHGANWTFVVWGLLYFALITFEKLTACPERFKSREGRGAYRIFTMLCVLAGWVVFRAENLSKALLYLRSMLGLCGNGWIDGHFLLYARENAVFWIVAALLSTPLFQWLRSFMDSRGKVLKCAADWSQVLVYSGLFLLAVSYLVVGGHNPFIYFNF